jgi:outer membrane protein assembly factor BamD (BamD/ComL family)
LTNWCRKCWQPINLVRRLLLVPALAGFLASVALAQQTLEDRYQRAVQAFNEAKMEEACDLFQQIEKERPAYKDTRTYLNPACDSVRRMYEQEEKLYKQGVELFQQGQFDEARQKFTQARELVLRHPKYRAEVDDYLAQIETRSREENLYQQAVRLFNEGREGEAAVQFAQIDQAKGARAADARAYLQRIKEHQVAMAQKKAVDADQQAFDDAVSAFNDKNYLNAKGLFQALVQKGSPHSTEAQTYLQQIDAALRKEAERREEAKKLVQQQLANDPRQVARQLLAEARTDMNDGQYNGAVEKLETAKILDPSNHDILTLLHSAQEKLDEQPLRLGLVAYFTGEYEQAEQQLDVYVANHGRKIALAYFFRGATHASRYFLSGERDVRQRDLAISDFRSLPKDAPQFQPPTQYVSPKILTLYSQAVETRQR